MAGEKILLRRFGKQLRSFRKQKMISYEELGMKIRLSAEDVSELEAGNMDPSLSTMISIAEALHIQPEDLFIPMGGENSQYYAYRCHLLKLINNLSGKEIKKAIVLLSSLSSDEK